MKNSPLTRNNNSNNKMWTSIHNKLTINGAPTTVKKIYMNLIFILGGARGGYRTHTELPPRDFKSLVSTIPPPGLYLNFKEHFGGADRN